MSGLGGEKAQNAENQPGCLGLRPVRSVCYQSLDQVKVAGIKFKTRKTIVYDNLGLLVKDIVFQCYQIPHC